MAKRSTAYENALVDYLDQRDALEAMVEAHPIIDEYLQRKAAFDDAETAFKDAAKADAGKDKNFRDIITASFRAKITSSREADVDLARKTFPKKVFDSLVKVKETIPIATLEQAVNMQMVSEDLAKAVIKETKFSIKIEAV